MKRSGINSSHIIPQFVVVVLILLISGCGTSIEYDLSDKSIGKEMIFNQKLFYSGGFKSGVLNKESTKYDCNLMGNIAVNSLHENHFKDGKKKFFAVKPGMRFIVRKSFRVVPWGLQAGFGNEYKVLVVQDEEGRLCTYTNTIGS